jgi:O-antigen/teichoic acid export membrane protein
MTGTAFAQLLFIVFSPVLTRLFTPVEFGIYAVFMNILSPLSIISTGRYEQAIVLPEKDEDAVNIFTLGVLFSAFFSLILVIILAIFNEGICDLINADYLGKLLFLIPLSLFFLSFSQGSTYWFIRKKKFRKSSLNKICQSSLNIASIIPMGYLKIGKGLVFGDTIGKFGLAVVSLVQSVNSGLNYRFITRERLRNNLREYSRFPIYNALPSLLVSLSLSLPIFFINSFYSGDNTGLVNQTRIALFVPLSLISAALSQVMLQRFSEKKQRGEPVMGDFFRVLRNTSILAVLLIIVIQLGGKELFRIIFGNQWEMSGSFSKILVFSYAIQFIVSPLSVVFIAFNQIKVLSIWQYFYFGCITLLFFARFERITDFLLLYAALDIICYSIFLYLIFRTIKDFEIKLKC